MQEPFYNNYNNPQGYYGGYYNQQMVEEMQRKSAYLAEAKNEKKEIRKYGNIIGLAITAFIAVQYAIVFIIQYSGKYNLYLNSNLFQYGVNAVGVSFFGVIIPFGIVALLLKKRYRGGEVVPFERVGALNTVLWLCFGMLWCIGANYATSAVIGLFKLFGYELTQSESLEPNSILSCLLYFIAISVMPAISEEFAMRCCALQLLRKHGKVFAVFAVSIVFGLLHGNVIQFVFAFLVGLVLAYITFKTDSILPAILIHGCNNAMSVVSSVVKLYAGSKASENVLVALYLIWAALGIVAAIWLIIKKQLRPLKEENSSKKNPYALTLGQKLSSFFFVPGMIFPVIYLIFLSVSTIKKV